MDAILNATTALNAPFVKKQNLIKPTLNKGELDSDIRKAADSPRAKLSDQARAFAKQKIEAIRKRLMVLKKLFANDPKQMAKALAQVFKELKAVLKEYKAAGDTELGASADIVSQAMTPETTASPEQTPEKPASDDTITPTDGYAAYSGVESGFRKMIGEDGMAFTRELTGMVNEIEDKILNAARIQMKAKKPEKEMGEAFKDAEDSLKDLRKSIDDMQRDIRHDVPDVGMRLSVAA